MTSHSVTAKKSRIAHLAGPNATIQNTPPLVTSNKARALHGLPLMTDIEQKAARFDTLRAQKLAAPATVYIEQFSAHPLEADSAHLYAPPDGYLNSNGDFSAEKRDASDTPVYKVELLPEDGYYPMPYMARKKDGQAWESDGLTMRSPRAESRQPFMPDGRRTFDEIDRLGTGGDGDGSLISKMADVDFYRLAPSGGYLNGNPDGKKEVPGRDFFPYRPAHLSHSPSRPTLARITNMAQKILSSGDYDGAIWTQGSPRVEETMYWFNLALDVTVPICGNASQRYHGSVSSDGQKNIVDSVEYIHSKAWADAEGKNRCGMVMVQDQRVFAAREVTKIDARPGGYHASGGHGGILAGASHGHVYVQYVPASKHTYLSEVNITRLPKMVMGTKKGAAGIETVEVAVKNEAGELLETAIPKVSVVKDSSYSEDGYDTDPSQEVDILALVDYMLEKMPLSGFVMEGLNPYGKPASASRNRAMMISAYQGFPVVNVGRGNTEGFAIKGGPFIAGSNLTATKARLLLMLCIMKFGMLPVAKDPKAPTPEEMAATEMALAKYQAVFNTH